MQWYCVKFFQLPVGYPEKVVLSQGQMGLKFPEKYEANKKYKIPYNDDNSDLRWAQILSVHDRKDEATTALSNSRNAGRPAKYLDTASSADSDSERIPKKSNNNEVNASDTTKYDAVRNQRLEKIRTRRSNDEVGINNQREIHHDHDESLQDKHDLSSDEEITNLGSHENSTTTNPTIQSEQHIEPSAKVLASDTTKHDVFRNQRLQNLKARRSSEDVEETKRRKSHHEENDESLKNEHNLSSEEEATHLGSYKDKPKIRTNQIVQPLAEITNTQNIWKASNIERLTKDNEDLKNQVQRLQDMLVQKDMKNIDLEIMLGEVESKNKIEQDKLKAEIDEKNSVIDSLLDELEKANRPGNFPQQGLVNVEASGKRGPAVLEKPGRDAKMFEVDENGYMHIGRQLWLPKTLFDLASVECSSPSQFVTNMAVAMFGYKILENATITGAKSNASKKTTNVDMDRLDPIAVHAIKLSFIQYLSDNYIMTKEKIDDMAEQTKKLICRKAASVKAMPKTKTEWKPRTRKTKKNDAPHPEITNQVIDEATPSPTTSKQSNQVEIEIDHSISKDDINTIADTL